MPDKKISALPAGGAPQATDEIPVARAGTTVKIEVGDLPGGVIPDGSITEAKLAFDTATQAELDAAVVALAAVYAPLARLITAGNGLAGGGDLSADRALSVNVDGTTIEIASDTLQLTDTGPGATGPVGDGTNVPVITIDAKGRVTALTSTAITGGGGGGSPTGSAGGALDGSYPNPGIAASVAGAGLAETSDVLSVNVDGSTLEINTDALRIKDGGVTAAKLEASPTGNNGKWMKLVSGAMVWTALAASESSIVDAGSYFSSGDVEGALQELGAAGAPTGGNLFRVYDSVLGADTANFDITSIPGGYKHLLLLLQARATGAVVAALVEARFNNDSSANYDYEYGGAFGPSNTITANGAAQTFLSIGDCPGASATAGYAATIRSEITNYAGTTFDKTAASQSSLAQSTAAAGIYVEVITGHWRTTATAITRITIFPSSGNFKAGSRCTLYALS